MSTDTQVKAALLKLTERMPAKLVFEAHMAILVAFQESELGPMPETDVVIKALVKGGWSESQAKVALVSVCMAIMSGEKKSS